VLGLACSACAGEPSAVGAKFKPAHAGVLTVATAFLPAPGFWQGRPPTRGFEAGLASALAHKLGLDRVQVVQVPFAQIVQGHLGGADLALSQLTPTKKREEAVDFTDSYLTAPPGVLTRLDAGPTDVKDLQQLRWVVSTASTLTPIVDNRIRPKDRPIITLDRTQALRVLRSGRADALLLDLPVALGLARNAPAFFHVPAQLDGDETLAAALPNGSSNLEVVDSAIRALVADGTVDKLSSRWLGESQDDVPLILTEQ
jgi:polar amino acid transport system substrate-binding protein